MSHRQMSGDVAIEIEYKEQQHERQRGQIEPAAYQQATDESDRIHDQGVDQNEITGAHE